MSNFQPLKVVDRGSETQPQEDENLNKLTLQDRGSYRDQSTSKTDWFKLKWLFSEFFIS